MLIPSRLLQTGRHRVFCCSASLGLRISWRTCLPCPGSTAPYSTRTIRRSEATVTSSLERIDASVPHPQAVSVTHISLQATRNLHICRVSQVMSSRHSILQSSSRRTTVSCPDLVQPPSKSSQTRTGDQDGTPTFFLPTRTLFRQAQAGSSTFTSPPTGRPKLRTTSAFVSPTTLTRPLFPPGMTSISKACPGPYLSSTALSAPPQFRLS